MNIRYFVSRIASAVLCLASVLGAQGQVNVTTYHYDNLRTGQNLRETGLTPGNINKNNFGKLFSQPVDGQVYAQPLYVSNLPIVNKGTHNVLFIATEHDSVYAFDADSNQESNAQPLWKVSFLNAASGVSTIPAADVGTVMISPEIGITSTPVIDPTNGTIYVVAATKENGKYFQRLHALDITSGSEKFGGPVVIQASVPGTGWGSQNGMISFDALRHHQRSALLLANGVVYIAWASHGLENQFIYHGWVMGYDEFTLQQVSAFAVTPNGKQGGIWQAGAGLSADSLGNIYFISGNGTFSANTGGNDYGMSFVKLTTTSGLSVADYFTPFNEAQLSQSDTDLGSSGPMLLPAQTGTAHPLLMVGAGKNGVIYLVDRNNMGHFSGAGNQQIVQSITNAFGGHGLYNAPAYWQKNLYFWGAHDFLRIFGISNGLLTTTPIAISTQPLGSGATPTISSNGANNGIVWAIQSDQASTGGPAVLHALDANTAVELYNSKQVPTRDSAGPAVKFSVPIVANGKVYLGTANQVSVYGKLQ